MGDMDLEGLKKLLAEATLPWFVAEGGVCSRECPEDGSNVICLEPEKIMAASLARWPTRAEIIVAAVNSLSALIERVERLGDVLHGCELWLTAALECKEWHWDCDQYEAAKQTRDEARSVLSTREGECGN